MGKASTKQLDLMKDHRHVPGISNPRGKGRYCGGWREGQGKGGGGGGGGVVTTGGAWRTSFGRCGAGVDWLEASSGPRQAGALVG